MAGAAAAAAHPDLPILCSALDFAALGIAASFHLPWRASHQGQLQVLAVALPKALLAQLCSVLMPLWLCRMSSQQ
jgi:hypothetical protein